MTQSIKIHNQEFILHPLGGMFWKDKSMLLISDVHLGKVGHFRKFGAAVPTRAAQKNFIMLDQIVAYFQPFQICFLGDLFHSSLNKEWQLFENWIEKTPSEIILVAGNHDIIAPERFESLDIQIFEEWVLDDFLLTHHPTARKGYFNFCGHIHPSVRLSGSGLRGLKLPCFYKTDVQMILPAFGTFTGTYTLEANEETEIFALTKEAVLPIATELVKKRKR